MSSSIFDWKKAMDDDAVPEAGAAPELTPALGASAPLDAGSHRPRWRVERAKTAVEPAPAKPQPKSALVGSQRLIADRILVQAGAGNELESVLPHIDQAISGLVVSAGRSGRESIHKQITGLTDRGFIAPVVFDPEGYRKHPASIEAPFHLQGDRLVPETLDDAISAQIALGAAIAQTPTGYICADTLDALEVAIELANRVEREDVLFSHPLDASVLDDPAMLARVSGLIDGVRMPVSLILGSQFDPFDINAEARVLAARSLAIGRTQVCSFRTDFNGFDLMGHGAFAAAIGVGGSKRHAVHPLQQSFSVNRKDPSPSVLYPRLRDLHRGSWIANVHGRLPAPTCEHAPCDGQSIARFLSRDYTDEARAHNVAVWQEWARLMLSNETVAQRATFWRNISKAAIDDHGLLAGYLGLPKSLPVRPQMKAWAKLPS
jgi:hypothetical protein